MSLARLVEVVRGDFVESFHFGAIAVADSTGQLLAVAGDPELSVCLRSAAKPFQALPLLLAGGAERFDLSDEAIALTASSHFAEPFHVERAREILAKGNFDESDLHCGAHWPGHEETSDEMKRRGQRPTAIHNNCSGKHGGMLLACRLRGEDPSRYWQDDSDFQKAILSIVARYHGLTEDEIGRSVDGCSVPAFHVPLRSAATAYARLLEDDDAVWPLSTDERRARDRITGAMRQRPEYVRGTGSITTLLMRAADGAILAKEGAEAYYAMALAPERSDVVRTALGLPKAPARAIGIALKIIDGYDRARAPVVLETLAQLSALPDTLPDELRSMQRPIVTNVRGDDVGEIRAVFRLEKQ